MTERSQTRARHKRERECERESKSEGENICVEREGKKKHLASVCMAALAACLIGFSDALLSEAEASSECSLRSTVARSFLFSRAQYSSSEG